MFFNMRYIAWTVLLFLSRFAECLYLPGVAPREYTTNSTVKLKVINLTSVKTQLPYDYYTLPFCKPAKIERMTENLGEELLGEVVESSPYEIHMATNSTCKSLCTIDMNEEDVLNFNSYIEDEYVVNWIIDNLPAATRLQSNYPGTDGSFLNGFPIGKIINGKTWLNNHVQLDLKFHASKNYKGFRIVGFNVVPMSIDHENTANGPNCSTMRELSLDSPRQVHFTYDVVWTASKVRWASRWDTYLNIHDSQIHWFSIINSLMIVFFLSGMVAMILLRTLHRDIERYNEFASADEASEERGWKLVHGDVFRKPQHSLYLAVLTGSGVQILVMACLTIIFAVLGFLSPAHRGGLLQAMLVLFTMAGALAGYCSARLYKFFKGENWKKTILLTAVLYPGVVFAMFFILDLIIWGEQSSGAVDFGTMFVLLLLWFGVSVPLVFMGSYMGYQAPAISLPVRTNQIPRQVPGQPWFIRPVFTCLIGGILPFGAVFTELFFMMSSIWQHQFYYLFGFLLLVLLILVITCAQISITLTYFQLASEDYNWWWRSFLVSGSSSVYVFLYSVMYFNSRLKMTRVASILLYFGYMLIISYSFFLLTGAIGFLATFLFVRSIYSSIKVD